MVMSLFSRKNNPAPSNVPVASTVPDNRNALAALVLSTIKEGIIITDRTGRIQLANPAAVTMTGCGSLENAVGLDWGLIIKLRAADGHIFTDTENPLIQALSQGRPVENETYSLAVANTNDSIPVAMSILAAPGNTNFIFVFRNIEKELAEESEKSDFISTASHEMRTPVASIEGYISLALNPQTATIDERARGYLTSAEKASKHLGHLFRDLLDTTKLEDGRIRPNLAPIEVNSFASQVTGDYTVRAKEANINLTFGNSNPATVGTTKLEQVIYGYADPDFLREVMDNLIDNAIKYTPNGGSVQVDVKADPEQFFISVADSGIGITAEDLEHIFQKFYRADNSDTRTIGGTGLGLYLAKQRVEAMNGHIWAESTPGQGTVFYVSLPRISAEEYEKRMIAINNNMNGGKQ